METIPTILAKNSMLKRLINTNMDLSFFDGKYTTALTVNVDLQLNCKQIRSLLIDDHDNVWNRDGVHYFHLTYNGNSVQKEPFLTCKWYKQGQNLTSIMDYRAHRWWPVLYNNSFLTIAKFTSDTKMANILISQEWPTVYATRTKGQNYYTYKTQNNSKQKHDKIWKKDQTTIIRRNNINSIIR